MIESGSNFNKLLNVSCKSVEIYRLMVQQSEKVNAPIRPTMHLLLSGKAGSFKSKLYKMLGSAFYKYKVHPMEWISDATAAGIAGSIDTVAKQRVLVYPVGYHAKFGTLFIDELNLNPKEKQEALRHLLTFLEDEKTARKLGISLKEPIYDEVNCFSSRDGIIKFWNLRCNVILATMRDIRFANSNNYYNALLTRAIPIIIDFERMDLLAILKDQDLLFHNLNYQPEKLVQIKQEDFDMMAKMVFEDKEIPFSHTVRCLNNMFRCLAVIGHHDMDLYNYIMNCHKKIPQSILSQEEKEENSMFPV